MVNPSDNFNRPYNIHEDCRNVNKLVKKLKTELGFVEKLSGALSKKNKESLNEFNFLINKINETLSLIPGEGNFSDKKLVNEIKLMKLDHKKALTVMQRQLEERIKEATSFLGGPNPFEANTLPQLAPPIAPPLAPPSRRTAGSGPSRALSNSSDGPAGSYMVPKDDLKAPSDRTKSNSETSPPVRPSPAPTPAPGLMKPRDVLPPIRGTPKLPKKAGDV